MALTYDFLMARAAECAVKADAASLDNVKEMALRSKAAWLEMAERTRKMEQEREKARLAREVRQIAEQLD